MEMYLYFDLVLLAGALDALGRDTPYLEAIVTQVETDTVSGRHSGREETVSAGEESLLQMGHVGAGLRAGLDLGADRALELDQREERVGHLDEERVASARGKTQHLERHTLSQTFVVLHSDVIEENLCQLKTLLVQRTQVVRDVPVTYQQLEGQLDALPEVGLLVPLLVKHLHEPV